MLLCTNMQTHNCYSHSEPPLLSPVIGLGKSCHHAGLQFPHGSQWEEECNTCRCVNGVVLCSKVSLASLLTLWPLDTKFIFIRKYLLLEINVASSILVTGQSPKWSSVRNGFLIGSEFFTSELSINKFTLSCQRDECEWNEFLISQCRGDFLALLRLQYANFLS